MKKTIVTSTLLIGSACAVLVFGACSPKTSTRAVGVVAAAVVSGAVSGAVGAKVAENYAIEKNNIQGNYLLVTKPETAYSLTFKREQTIPAGKYRIKARGTHSENGLPYVVVGVKSNNDLVVFIKG